MVLMEVKCYYRVAKKDAMPCCIRMHRLFIYGDGCFYDFSRKFFTFFGPLRSKASFFFFFELHRYKKNRGMGKA